MTNDSVFKLVGMYSASIFMDFIVINSDLLAFERTILYILK